jgi:SpoVK/Ycf46/Vps4 family AAA+-type ATPase
MEDNRWCGSLFLGSPGSGKTLATSCIGNTYKCLSLVGDLGATKNSLLGESEARMRRMMDVIWSLGAERVYVVATCNKLGIMPPELLRRFNCGIWLFDVPTPEERKKIWKIQSERFGISLKQKLPDDEGWVGSDIRNCVERAWMLKCNLVEASNFITISGKVSIKDISQLRDLAETSGFLCANNPGPYKRSHDNGDMASNGRALKLT